MSGPDQPAQPHQPYRRQDGVEADESETTIVDARSLGADESGRPPADEVPQAWSSSADESVPTTATPYPRAYRPVDEDDPTDAPLSDSPGTFGGAPAPESADERAASPYDARSTAAIPAVIPVAPQAGSDPDDPTTATPAADDDDQHEEHFPSSGPAQESYAQEPVRESALPEPTAPQRSAATASAEGPGSTAAYQPFQSAAQPAVAPFPAPTAGGAADDATRALPESDVGQDPFARPYPAAAEPLAQPEYIPPPAQPAAPDERDTFIGQPARPDEPDLLPEKRRIWQNLLGALIGLVLVLGPIVGFALWAGTPDSLFDPAVARRFLLLGIIVVAAVPALLAGWAPATAWLPGGILAVVGAIAFLSDSFTLRLRSWSRSLFDTEVAGSFLAQYAVVIGLVLLFAGLGAAWARNSGADSVIRRIPTRG